MGTSSPLALPLLLLFAVATGVAGCAARTSTRVEDPSVVAQETAAAQAGVQWREFKLALRPDSVGDVGSAAKKFWAIASPLAEKHGARVRPPRKPFKQSKQEVALLDTEDSRLKSQGLILRKRGRDDAPGGSPACEYTLKRRSADVRVAFASTASLQPADGKPAAVKLKDEVVVDPARAGAARNVYAAESTVRTTLRSRKVTVGDVIAVFPGIASSAGSPEAALVPVNGVRIEQVQVDLGEVVFTGGSSVKPMIIVWRERGGGNVVAAEFTFGEKLVDGQSPTPADDKAMHDYFAALQGAARDWVATPTQTASIYSDGIGS